MHGTKFEKLGVSLDFDSSVLAVLLRLDNYNAFIQKNNIKDRDLLKFAIINISNEVMSESFKTEAVDMGGDSIFLILELSKQEEIDLVSLISTRLNTIKAPWESISTSLLLHPLVRRDAR